MPVVAADPSSPATPIHPHTRAYARESALIASGVVTRRRHLPPTPSPRHAPEEHHARRPLRRSRRLVP